MRFQISLVAFPASQSLSEKDFIDPSPFVRYLYVPSIHPYLQEEIGLTTLDSSALSIFMSMDMNSHEQPLPDPAEEYHPHSSLPFPTLLLRLPPFAARARISLPSCRSCRDDIRILFRSRRRRIRHLHISSCCRSCCCCRRQIRNLSPAGQLPQSSHQPTDLGSLVGPVFQTDPRGRVVSLERERRDGGCRSSSSSSRRLLLSS